MPPQFFDVPNNKIPNLFPTPKIFRIPSNVPTLTFLSLFIELSDKQDDHDDESDE